MSPSTISIRAPHVEVYQHGTCPNVMYTDAERRHRMVNVPKLIVVHTTETPCLPGDRYGVAAGFMVPGAQKSAQYVVDPAGVLQVVWDGQVSDNCGLNPDTLAIEHCAKLISPAWDRAHASRWTTDPNHAEVLRRGANLAARAMLAYNIPQQKVGPDQLKAWVNGGRRHPLGYCGHDTVTAAFPEFTSHWDPGPAFPWGAYAAQLHKHTSYIMKRARAGKAKP